MASKFSIEAVYKLIDQFSAPLKAMGFNSKSFSKGLKTDFAMAQRSVNDFTTGLKRNAWLGVTALAIGIGAAAKEGIQLASDLLEVKNVVDTTFGDNSKKIDKWSKSAITNFGLGELQAKKFNGTLGAMMKSAGVGGDSLVKMSTDLTGLAGDYASFYNLDIEEAFTKIRSGISGESEPLKQIGKDMSVTGLKAFALSQGIKKSYESMSMSEKYQLRYSYLLSQSKDQIGDFNKTLKDSWANQQRVLQTKFGQKLAEVFQKLIPLLIDGASKFSAWLDTLDTGAIADFIVTIFNGVKLVINVFLTVIKIIKPFASIIMGIIAAFMAYRTALIVAAVAQGILNAVMTANPIGIIIVAIGALIGLIVLMVKNWDKITEALKKSWEWIVKTAEWIWKTDEGFTKFASIITVVLGPLGLLVTLLMSIGRNFDGITEKFKSGDIIGGILKIGGTIISAILAPIQGLLELLSNIPGLGDIAKGGAAKIAELRAFVEGKSNKENQAPVNAAVNPYERATVSKSVSSGELVIKDQTGRAEMQNVKGSPGYSIKLQTSGGFAGGQ